MPEHPNSTKGYFATKLRVKPSAQVVLREGDCCYDECADVFFRWIKGKFIKYVREKKED